MTGVREREIMKDLINASCAKSRSWGALCAEKQASIVRKIERSCLNNAVITCERDGLDRRFGSGNSPFIMRYQANCYRIISNIDIDSSVHTEYLINQICNNNIDIDNIATLSSYELYPLASQAERDEINMRKEQRIEQKVSRMYTCRRCGKSETTSIEYAPRAADELTSRSIKCIHCNNIWRIS
jgi:DNA-directed RNA polymerase subunit M/transcription elongation factor TFIIS